MPPKCRLSRLQANTQIVQINNLELALLEHQAELQKLREESAQKDAAIQDLETALHNRRIIADSAKKASKLHKDNLSKYRREIARLRKQVQGMDEEMLESAAQEVDELAGRPEVGSVDGVLARFVAGLGH